MNFNKHLDLEGKHAFLSASKYSWLNYDNDKLINAYISSYGQQIGTLLHEYAKDHIRFGIKMSKSDKHNVLLHLLKNGIPSQVIDIEFLFPNLMTYVNDAIGFRMEPEQVLRYSDNCFGTADSIAFRNDFLRIHDYKSGITPAHMEQLEIYSGLFCLEYKIKPSDIQTELRIYQANEVVVYNPEPNRILTVCNKIVESDNILLTLTR